MNKSVLSMAARIDRALARSFQEYLDDCDAWRKDGYRPHYCEHGTNMWTDYDNICGPCEDGYSMGDPMFRMGFAIAEAKYKDESCRKLITAACDLRDLMPDFDMEPVWKRVAEIIDSCDRY